METGVDLAVFGHEAELHRQLELERPVHASRGLPFSQYLIDLSRANIETTGERIAAKGERLIYRQEGSNPAGRLHVDVGGRVEDLYPGAVLEVPFEGLTVVRSPRSAAVGYARLIVCASRD